MFLERTLEPTRKHMKKVHISVAAALAALMLAFTAPASAGFFDYWIQRNAVEEIVTNVNLSNVAQQYTKYYATSAQFNDPTVTVNGRDNIIAHLQVALRQVSVDAIRVSDIVQTGDTWVALYEMDTHLLVPIDAAGNTIPVGEQVTLIAATVMKFNHHNKVVYHRDYWDQFAMFEQIPGFDAQIQGIVGQWIGTILGGGP
jgi:hypothetical protein